MITLHIYHKSNEDWDQVMTVKLPNDDIAALAAHISGVAEMADISAKNLAEMLIRLRRLNVKTARPPRETYRLSLYR